jgi:hypothetical protein
VLLMLFVMKLAPCELLIGGRNKSISEIIIDIHLSPTLNVWVTPQPSQATTTAGN